MGLPNYTPQVQVIGVRRRSSTPMDPTYPLVPILNIVSACLVLFSLLNRSIHHHWNIGVGLLGAWVFVEDLIGGIDSIVWADNADDKSPIWCDISSHISVGFDVAVPARSLVITRRLFKITRLRSVEPPSALERRLEIATDLSLGLGIPVLTMGLFVNYILQGARYQVIEELGCGGAVLESGVSVILIFSWGVILPAISIIFYCPGILWTFYRHTKQINRFLQTDSSLTRRRYFRVLALGLFDALVTLPLGAAIFTMDIRSTSHFVFYQGWDLIHTGWEPVVLKASQWKPALWASVNVYYVHWRTIVLALGFFFLFGTTGEAREVYRRVFWATVKALGIRRRERTTTGNLSIIVFEPPLEGISKDDDVTTS
ncbi:pheromone A receptor-domain-containing protein [Amylostereum chailletii]|nr:pheromone A receptor-domain-containing protein [Amylostereum chailletii]